MQQHQFRNRSNIHEFYYQQRYQSMDADDAYTARELMKKEWEKDPLLVEGMSQRLHVTSLLDRPLIQLSNGENKRVQLLRALLKKPDLLILDNPFIGLDTEGRALLHKLLDDISRENITLLVICPPEEIPACSTHVAVLDGGKLTFAGNRSNYSTSSTDNIQPFQPSWNFPGTAVSHSFQHAVEMRDIHIEYEGKQILQAINWSVTRGSCWLLSGPNGAGKSTLLSLINADNPQAYANEIYLFDQRRGRGESIYSLIRGSL
jgi:molybdate transport system ATP-binding protein